MAQFVVQGEPEFEDLVLQQVEALGGVLLRPLANLSALSNSTLLIFNVPDGVTHEDLLALEGVYAVEGRFMHPFYSCGVPEMHLYSAGLAQQETGPRIAGGLLTNVPPRPQDYLAAALQWLPPEAWAQLPTAEMLTALLNLNVADAGAFSAFDVSQHPFGRPGLFLGPPATQQEFEEAGDLERILATIRVPQAHQLNRGQGAVVAVVDSGVHPMWVPEPNRLLGWSSDGVSDPWSDPVGHGSMVAAILMAVAPECQVVSVRPEMVGDAGMSSLGTLSSFDFLAGLALDLGQPVVANHSWGIWGTKNLILPCTILITRTTRLLDELGLVMTCWAAGNNRDIAGDATISGYCMSTSKWAVSCGALDRHLRPQFYSSWGAQCWPLNPTLSAPTYGVLPWGGGYIDMGEEGGATSSCAPMASGVLAMMMTAHPGRPFAEYRAALRASARNDLVGLPGIPYHPATGAGVLQADGAVRAVPWARAHPSYWVEQLLETSVARLGSEPERRR